MRLLILLTLLSTGLSAQLIGDTENGLASYYSREYDGAETAYGLIYRRDELVAAHKSFPVNSTVRVKNMDNDKSVQVRIIDKGPFIRGRIIEVSERAAEMLGMVGKVTVPVEITLKSTSSGPPPEPAVSTTAPRRGPSLPEEPTPAPSPSIATPAEQSDALPASSAAAPSPTAPAAAPTPAKPVAEVRAEPAAAPVKVTREPALPSRPKETKAAKAEKFTPGIYKIELSKKPEGNFGVQVGSFSDLEGAMDKVTALQAKWFDDILIERVKVTEGSHYKVILGPFATMDSAKSYAADLKKRYGISGFSVELK